MDFHDHKIGAKDISFRQHYFKANGICRWRFKGLQKKKEGLNDKKKN